MTDDECALAMTAFRQAWQYTPMSDIQARQFQRLFSGHQTATVRSVIDDLIRVGATRPGPAEMGDLLRSKAGLTPAGGRARRDGPFLDDTCPEAEVTDPDAVPDFIAAVRAGDLDEIERLTSVYDENDEYVGTVRMPAEKSGPCAQEALL